MRRLAALLAGLLLLSGCAPNAREPADLALVRVLGVDGAGPVTLTAVCGGSDQEAFCRGACAGGSFQEAKRALPWSGREELSLTSVSYLLVGPDADLYAVAIAILNDPELGGSATVWLAPEGAAALLDGCDDPASGLELLTGAGAAAPTVAQAAAALAAEGQVTLPRVAGRDGQVVEQGETVWKRNG
ncbi:MAG: hypothetical protein ACI4OU_06460 [Candidatus Enterenecus sp.]